MNWNKLSLNNNYRVTKKKKKKAKKKLPKKFNRLIDFYAHQLNTNVPKSEVWFRELYNPYLYTMDNEPYTDKYNAVIGNHIVDLANKRFMYAVEIDGSIHNTKAQKLKDAYKDAALTLRGYTVFRIPAYDNAKCTEVIQKILSLRIT